MPRKELVNDNQTSFMAQAPLWQKTVERKVDLQKASANKFKFRWWYLVPLLLMLSLLLAAWLASRRVTSPIVTNQPVSPSTQSAQLLPLEQRINDLQQTLEAADPTRQNLPFPNVNLELSFP